MKKMLGIAVLLVVLTGCSERKQPETSTPVTQPVREEVPFEAVTEPAVVEPDPEPEPEPEPEPAPRWREVGRFGPNSMVWIDKDAVNDDVLIAEILGQLLEKHGNRSVLRFFDNRQRTPRRAHISNEELLHMVGEYDGFRSTTYYRVEITNRNATPPQYRLVETDIVPARVDP